MPARLFGRVRLLVAVLAVAVLLAHSVVRPCGRYGCYRSFVGRWLVAQGGVLAELVHGVEVVVSALAVAAVVGYGVSRLRR